MGVEEKVCSTCGETKSLSEYYSRKAVTKAKGEYTYYVPECKKCTSARASKWKRDNKKASYEYTRNRQKEMPEYYKRIRRTHYENNKEKEAKRLKEWQQSNPEKLREYRIKREQNKTHKISKKEWLACKDYFNNICAYCGLHQENHFRMWRGVMKNIDLHKEHVDHKGANDLSNCVPSCQSCNSSKHNFELDDWYNESNSDFTIKRLSKIREWLASDWEDYYENKN